MIVFRKGRVKPNDKRLMEALPFRRHLLIWMFDQPGADGKYRLACTSTVGSAAEA